MNYCIKENMVKIWNRNSLVVLMALFFFVQCESNEEAKRVERAEMALREKWDHESYLEFKEAVFYYDYSDYSDDSREYIQYSYIMANSFNDGHACYDVATHILDVYHQNKLKLDSTATAHMIDYFEKGAKLGNDKCKTALYLLYSRGGFSGFEGIVEVDSVRASKYKRNVNRIQ